MARAPGAAAHAPPRGTLGAVVRQRGRVRAARVTWAAGGGRESAEGAPAREWGGVKTFILMVFIVCSEGLYPLDTDRGVLRRLSPSGRCWSEPQEAIPARGMGWNKIIES